MHCLCGRLFPISCIALIILEAIIVIGGVILVFSIMIMSISISLRRWGISDELWSFSLWMCLSWIPCVVNGLLIS